MKTYLLIFVLLTSAIAIGQNHFNEQKKHVAEGYDVVAYFNNEAVKGSKDFSVDYNNASFLFSRKQMPKSLKPIQKLLFRNTEVIVHMPLLKKVLK